MDRRRSSLALAALGLLATAAGTAQAACECGYQTGDGSVWSHAMTADFSSMADADTIADSGISSDWYAQTWSTGAGTAAYQMQNNVSNAYVQNGNLVIKTSGYSGSGAVQVGEVDTARTDILYGSFRSSFSVEATPGVCAGFFYYKSDTQETDIEVLTWESTNKIHYSNQPAYDASIDDSVPGATYADAVSGGWTSSIQHRFDWQPSVTTFYQNGNAIRQMTKNVPSTPGAVIMNVWSDGGDWTQGPPTADAHMYISNYQFYFNVTNDQQGSASTFEKSCAAAGGVGAVPYCLVDGAVTGKATVASSTSTSSTAAAASSAASNISPDNSCGPSSAGNYTCPDNGCCSSHGWCGTTSDYCGTGCQPAYGTCAVSASTLASSSASPSTTSKSSSAAASSSTTTKASSTAAATTSSSSKAASTTAASSTTTSAKSSAVSSSAAAAATTTSAAVARCTANLMIDNFDSPTQYSTNYNDLGYWTSDDGTCASVTDVTSPSSQLRITPQSGCYWYSSTGCQALAGYSGVQFSMSGPSGSSVVLEVQYYDSATVCAAGNNLKRAYYTVTGLASSAKRFAIPFSSFGIDTTNTAITAVVFSSFSTNAKSYSIWQLALTCSSTAVTKRSVGRFSLEEGDVQPRMSAVQRRSWDKTISARKAYRGLRADALAARAA